MQHANSGAKKASAAEARKQKAAQQQKASAQVERKLCENEAMRKGEELWKGGEACELCGKGWREANRNGEGKTCEKAAAKETEAGSRREREEGRGGAGEGGRGEQRAA